MRFALVVAAATLALAMPAQAAGWMAVSEDSDGTIWLINPENIRRSDDVITAWIKLDHTHDRTVTARRSMYHEKINCSARTHRVLQLVRYGPSGAVVQSVTEHDFGAYNALDYRGVIPDTSMETALDTICRFARERLITP